jgi:hypothetical protein
MPEGEIGIRVSKSGAAKKSSVAGDLPLLDLENFKGEFSFDDFFKDLATDVLPLFQDDNPKSSDNGQGTFPNGDLQENGVKGGGKLVGVPFVEAEALLPVCRDTRKELVDLCYQVDARLETLKEHVEDYDVKHETKFIELEKGVERLFESFSRLDSRISGVGQTAARIGDHLQVPFSALDSCYSTLCLF